MQTWLNRYYTITAWVLLIQRCWLSPVYAIQPVVKRDVKPFWQPVKCLYTRYNRLSNGLYNRFDNRLYRVNKHPKGYQSGCQTGLTTGLTTVLNEQPLFVQPIVISGLTTVLNEQLFVQPVVKPGCTTGLTTGCINDTAGCQASCQTGLTTGWMFVYTM